jgi:hypothetical protein
MNKTSATLLQQIRAFEFPDSLLIRLREATYNYDEDDLPKAVYTHLVLKNSEEALLLLDSIPVFENDELQARISF